MCGIFGFSDAQRALTPKQRQVLIKALAVASEERGTDSTGIAYNSYGHLNVYKRPIPARRFTPKLPPDAITVIGHTRYATQGNAKFNINNHPFRGKAGYMDFALTHNGVLYNDATLRREEHLPKTSIETDSYIAVQLLEKSEQLSINSLADMVEKLSGSFIFSILNTKNDLYLVKGDNPVCLYRFPNGLYVYASTSEIFRNALRKLPWPMSGGELLTLKNGDILKIRNDGNLKYGKFTPVENWHYFHRGYYSAWDDVFFQPDQKLSLKVENDYVEEVSNYARYAGISDAEIQLLVESGFDIIEIGDLLYDPELLEQFVEEIRCNMSCKNLR